LSSAKKDGIIAECHVEGLLGKRRSKANEIRIVVGTLAIGICNV
jgi:hypothetical protein